MKLKIEIYSREEGMGISAAKSVVVDTSLKPAELGKVLSPLTPYGVQISRELRTKVKPISLVEALLWIKDLKLTKVVLVPTTTTKLELVGVLNPLIYRVESSSSYHITFFHSIYLTLEGAAKVLWELGITNVHLAKSGAFYVYGEYVKHGNKLYKQEHITTIEKKIEICIK